MNRPRFFCDLQKLLFFSISTKTRPQFAKCCIVSSSFYNSSSIGPNASKNFTQRKHNLKFKSLFHSTTSRNAIVPFKLSDIGEGIKEVEVLEWYVNVGDEVSQFDSICEVQSDKASVTITSRFDGTVKKLHFNVGAVAQVGDSLIDIDVAEEISEVQTTEIEQPVVAAAPEETLQSPQSPVPDIVNKVLATPAVRGLAKEHNLNLTDIKGSGDGGRVMKEDILKHIGVTEKIGQPPPTPRVSASSVDRIEPIKGIRKAMLTSMNAALLIPHFGYDEEYDLTDLVSLRYRLKKQVKQEHDLKLSYMPFIIKATSLALTQYPILNSQIESGNENLIYKADHNISIATDTPHGLLLPCIKGVQNLSILEIALELNRLHEAGLKNKISPDDIAGGTFSLSNIGNIGGTYARPVIFPPQVAIGALGRIQELPRFDHNGNVVCKNIMRISWSGDHRVIEGAVMARFSNSLKDYLENPAKMLLHLK